MKVAIIVPALRQLGPVIVMQTLVNSLRNSTDVEIDVYYFDKKKDNNLLFSVPVYQLNLSDFCFADYDVIHTNGIRPDLFAWFNRRKIKFHISTIHSIVFDDLMFTYNRLISSLFGNLWLFLWKKADKLVCVSYSMKNYYEKWFTSTKIEVIHNGISNSDVRTSSEDDVVNAINEFRSEGLKIIGSAGVLTKIKGIDHILFQLKKNSDLSLVLIGDGKELPNLKKLAAKLKISNRINFCGFRSNAFSYFKYFDYFLMPSRSEGFGLALMEAVQQKVPVICSDIPVFKELFNNEEVTFFELDNSDSLAGALNEVKTNGSKKSELAYSRYLNFYTDKQMSQKYLELYQSASFSSLCLTP